MDNQSKDRRGSWIRPIRWVGENVGKTVFTALVGMAATAGIALVVAKPDIREQLEEVRTEAAKRGYSVLTQEELPLRTAGSAHLFVLKPPGDRSDEIRIYNEDRKELELAFRFAPEGRVGTEQASEWLSFDVVAASDFGDDGRHELIGSYNHSAVGGGGGLFRIPMSIHWDDGARHYRLSPLIPERPSVETSAIPSDLRAAYRFGADIRLGKERLRGWGAQSLAVLPKDQLLLAGFPASSDLRLTQVNAWSVRYRSGDPDVWSRCVTGRGGAEARERAGSALSRGDTAGQGVVVPSPALGFDQAEDSDQEALVRAWRKVQSEDRQSRQGGSGKYIVGASIDGNCLFGE